jgi:hypothetical protein
VRPASNRYVNVVLTRGTSGLSNEKSPPIYVSRR